MKFIYILCEKRIEGLQYLGENDRGEYEPIIVCSIEELNRLVMRSHRISSEDRIIRLQSYYQSMDVTTIETIINNMSDNPILKRSSKIVIDGKEEEVDNWCLNASSDFPDIDDEDFHELAPPDARFIITVCYNLEKIKNYFCNEISFKNDILIIEKYYENKQNEICESSWA